MGRAPEIAVFRGKWQVVEGFGEQIAQALAWGLVCGAVWIDRFGLLGESRCAVWVNRHGGEHEHGRDG